MMISITSCSNEYEEAVILEEVEQNSSSMEGVLSRAAHFYSLLPNKTRGVIPKVSGIEVISKMRTRANGNEEEEAPLYYLVNYEDNEGFVIVGGNDNSEPLVAVSDEGNLHLTDTLGNPALASFINDLSSPDKTITLPDSIINRFYPIRVSVEPLLPDNVRKWGTGAPFNSNTPLVSGQRSKLSCAALSCAMMMSCYRWPDVYKYSYIDWGDIINNNCHDTLCQILADMGKSYMLNTTYGVNESFSNVENIQNVFDQYYYGYYTDGLNLKNFDVSSKEKVRSQLPVLMWGDVVIDNQIFTHTWVIDGLLHVLPSDEKYYGITKPEYFMHCVWGKYGVGNGYFKLTRLDSIGGHRFTIDSGDGSYSGFSDSSTADTYTNTSYMYRIYKKDPILFNE